MTNKNFYSTKEYKDREKTLNRAILHSLDCEYFIKLIAIMLELHLHQAEYFRKYSEMISSLHHYPTKKEVTDVTRIWIRLESRYDDLEMSLYDFNKGMVGSTKTISNHNSTLEELKEFLADEM